MWVKWATTQGHPWPQPCWRVALRSCMWPRRERCHGHACNGQKRNKWSIMHGHTCNGRKRNLVDRVYTAGPRTHARVDYTGRFCSSRASEQSNCCCPWPESAIHSSMHAHEVVQCGCRCWKRTTRCIHALRCAWRFAQVVKHTTHTGRRIVRRRGPFLQHLSSQLRCGECGRRAMDESPMGMGMWCGCAGMRVWHSCAATDLTLTHSSGHCSNKRFRRHLDSALVK